MKYLLLILFSCLLFSASAQKREFLDEKYKSTTDSTLAKYVKTSEPDGKKHVIEKIYLVEGNLIEEFRLTRNKNLRDGIWKTMYEKTGKAKYEGFYENGKLNGPFRTYFENGQLRRDELYENNILISGRCFTQTGNDTTHYLFETPPMFPGGEKELYDYLSEHLKILVKNRPSAANNTYGRTIVTFMIEKDGSITESKIVKSANKQFDKPILRIINGMPHWEPGKQEGIPMKVLMTLPVRFN